MILPDTLSAQQWYPLCMADSIGSTALDTLLLGQPVSIVRHALNEIQVWWGPRRIACRVRYGYVWTSLLADDTKCDSIPEIEEAEEPGRRLICCGSIFVAASGLRVVENFLDMAHFPFVHTGILGAEPHTEVGRYAVETRCEEREIWATKCRFFQPKAALSAEKGIMTDYTYRVAAPFSTLLYKTCPNDPAQKDIIALFVQPMTEGTCRTHPIMFLINDESEQDALVEFQQMIFLQDRTILENQRPVLMPLDVTSEIPTPADRVSVAYRRWLKAQGVRFGATTSQNNGPLFKEEADELQMRSWQEKH